MTNGTWRRSAGVGVLAALVAASTAGPGAFGESGHRVVGTVAELHLRKSRALEQVRKILRPQETLADASVWPDTIKDPIYEDDDTPTLRLEHPAHDTYHYANLPFQADRYDPLVPGARPTDIVQMLRECIRVLRGTSAVFTPREALRLLAHFVGDIHQPLHAWTGFVTASGPMAFTEPTGPTGWRMTLGGNALLYGPQDRFNLHSYWDTHAVNLTMQKEGVEAFSARLFADPIDAQWRNKGDADSWPEQWANDALPHAKKVHEGIKLTAYLGPDEARRVAHRWRIEQPAGYDDIARSILRLRLAAGGYRLSATLKAIWPDGQ